MSVAAEANVDLSWLTGRTCTRVQRLASGGFGFEFGEAVLRVEGAWRIRGDDTILFGRRDGDDLFASGAALDAAMVAATLLVGPPVIGAGADGATGDLEIAFASGHRLQAWTDGTGHEPWSLSDPAGGRWTAQPGGRIAAEAPSGGDTPA